MGVLAALQSAGFKPGDDLRVGEHEFGVAPWLNAAEHNWAL